MGEFMSVSGIHMKDTYRYLRIIDARYLQLASLSLVRIVMVCTMQIFTTPNLNRNCDQFSTKLCVSNLFFFFFFN